MGRVKPVYIYRLVAQGTIEDAIYRVRRANDSGVLSILNFLSATSNEENLLTPRHRQTFDPPPFHEQRS